MHRPSSGRILFGRFSVSIITWALEFNSVLPGVFCAASATGGPIEIRVYVISAQTTERRSFKSAASVPALITGVTSRIPG